MRLKPIYTEKSNSESRRGRYSFWVDPSLNKGQIKAMIADTFGVDVVGVTTINYKGGKKRTLQGKIKTIRAQKKATVTLKKDQKIDIFEEEKEKKVVKKTKKKS
jgi:large subunit ribosomal protein L23